MALGQAPLQISIALTANCDEYAAISLTGGVAGAGAGDAGEAILGFANVAGSSGQIVPVNWGGVSQAVSGAAINGSERRLKTAANGRLIPWTSGSNVAAILMPGETAAGAGERIRVLVRSGNI